MMNDTAQPTVADPKHSANFRIRLSLLTKLRRLAGQRGTSQANVLETLIEREPEATP
jgi:hypothetical protein